MDVVVEVCLHVPDTGMPEARRTIGWSVGDIVDVRGISPQLAKWDGMAYVPQVAITMPRSRYIFVTGAPDIGIVNLKHSLCFPHLDAMDSSILKGQRLWRFVLTPAEQSLLETEKHFTIPFSQMKQKVKNKRTSAFLIEGDF